MATVKKERLVFLPINGTRSSSGQALAKVTIIREDGDQHRFHISDRDSYSGVRAYWHDAGRDEPNCAGCSHAGAKPGCGEA